MIKIDNIDKFVMVQIDIQGSDNLGYFSDIIKFIIEKEIDLGGSKHTTIYDICEKEVNQLNVGNQTIDYAMAYIYDLNGNLLNQFYVLD